MPGIDIEPTLDDKGNPTGKYTIEQRIERTETRYPVSNAAYDAWVRYRSALKGMIGNSINEDLDGSYDRFPVKAMRLATLIASLQGASEITLPHWALAQEVTETWRASLHEMYVQVNSSIASNVPTIEDQIIDQLKKLHDKGIHSATGSTIAHAMHKTAKDIQPHLMYLARDGVLIQEEGRQNPKYRAASF
jgi:hypothetical protein